MRALLLEKTDGISPRDIEIVEMLGPRDVRIAIRNVGSCGSDIHCTPSTEHEMRSMRLIWEKGLCQTTLASALA